MKAFIAMVLLGSSYPLACISEERRGSDGADAVTEVDATQPVDATDAPDTPEPTDATEPTDADTASADASDSGGLDTADTELVDSDVRIDEVVVLSCSEASDCTAPLSGQCSQWTCPEGLCEAGPLTGGSCDDGDLCTGPGRCSSGVCLPGAKLTCDSATVCSRPGCDPATGCTSEPVAGGICEVLGGVAWGACDGARMAPLDSCTTHGECVDQTTDQDVPLPKDRVIGDWFVIIQGVTNSGVVGTTAGLVTFDSGGKWGGTLRTESAPFVLDDSVGDRGWCIDANLGLGFNFAINHFVGQVEPDGKTMVASGQLGKEVFVGVRPIGNVSDVNGTYATLMTTVDAGGHLRVLVGTLVFETGCLREGSVFIGGANDEPIFIADSASCMNRDSESKLVTFDLPTETEDGAGLSQLLRGAVGEGGDVVLLDREGAGSSIRDGMFLLVRLDDSAQAAFVGDTRWAFAFQELSANGYRGIPGAALFRNATLLNGTFGGAYAFGDDIAFDDYGRYVMWLRTAAERRTWSGYLAKSVGLGFFYEVEAPAADWLTLFDISETPASPAFGVIIQRE